MYFRTANTSNTYQELKEDPKSYDIIENGYGKYGYLVKFSNKFDGSIVEVSILDRMITIRNEAEILKRKPKNQPEKQLIKEAEERCGPSRGCLLL